MHDTPENLDAMPLGEFARRHGISRSYVYKLISEGRGPQTMKIGRRTLVSREAAAEWRRRIEAESREAAG